MALLAVARFFLAGTVAYTAAMSWEEELKFPVTSLAGVAAKLDPSSRHRSQGPALERNWVLDDEHQSLKRRGCLLRVREWAGEGTVTYKGPASFSGGIKRRQEVELTSVDATKALELFAALGFAVTFRYEKIREKVFLGPVVVALDRTPMGEFVELEGPPEAIRSLAEALGFFVEDALRGSYLELWQEARAKDPYLPADMIFSGEAPFW